MHDKNRRCEYLGMSMREVTLMSCCNELCVSSPSYFVCIRVRDAEVVRNVARIQDEVTDQPPAWLRGSYCA